MLIRTAADVISKGLDPTFPHSDLGHDGMLKTVTPIPEVPELVSLVSIPVIPQTKEIVIPVEIPTVPECEPEAPDLCQVLVAIPEVEIETILPAISEEANLADASESVQDNNDDNDGTTEELPIISAVPEEIQEVTEDGDGEEAIEENEETNVESPTASIKRTYKKKGRGKSKKSKQ